MHDNTKKFLILWKKIFFLLCPWENLILKHVKYHLVYTCVQGIALTVLFPCAPISEQKPKARRQHPAQYRRPGRPPVLSLPGIIGHHVWGWSAHNLHPWQPGSCQPARCAIGQSDKGPLTRYAGCYISFWVHGSSVSLRKFSWQSCNALFQNPQINLL